MDSLEASVMQADPTPEDVVIPPSQDPGQPVPDPVVAAKLADLDTMKSNMNKDYTQKNQQLAEDRRQFSDERRQFFDQQSLQTAQAAGPTSQTIGLAEKMALQNPNLADPAVQATLSGIEGHFSEKFGQLETKLQERDGRIAELAQQNTKLQNDQLTRDFKSQYADVVAKYGQEQIDLHGAAITQAVQQSFAAGQPLSIEGAMMYAAPQVVQNHYKQQALKEAQEQFANQDNAQLNGMEEIFGAPPEAKYKQGEDMMTSAMRHLSPQDKQEMLRDELGGD